MLILMDAKFAEVVFSGRSGGGYLSAEQDGYLYRSEEAISDHLNP